MSFPSPNIATEFWPSLLDVTGFLQQFITPIVKVTKGKNSRQFFTLPEYEQWLESTGNNGKGFTIKYYKGLGTSTSAEAKEYFSNLDLHEVQFDLITNDLINKEDIDEEGAAPQVLPENVVSGSDLIDMVFRKDRVEDRKLWLSHVRKDVFLDFTKIAANGLRYSDFINKEYILFSNYDNDRSIPHVMDGFKPSQRKVLFGCFKRKLYKNEIKVAQLVGYVAEHSAYHHGEASLQGTIVSMAQNFVGSNNINLLTPSGQFGTRRMGGNDAASPRYIFTKVEAIARAIFHPDDDELLTYLNDDGSNIEPEFYVPVIPMALVNGAEGIGTGWSSKICNYSPREIIANLRRVIAGEEMKPMSPFYGGFTGLIEEEKQGKYTSYGKIERVNETTLAITELPIKKWTQNFKEFLEGMLVGDSKVPPELKDMRENHTETTVSFTITATQEKIDEWEKEPKGGLYAKFKLTASLSTSNMTLFDEESRITKYETPEDIVSSFYAVRLRFYVMRKENLVRNLEAEKKMLSNKARFIEEVCSTKLVVSNRKRREILEELQQRRYDLIAKPAEKSVNNDDESSDAEDDVDTSISTLAKGFEYLLGMKIWSLTFEKAQQLREELEKKSGELVALQATEPTTIWERDLEAIESALDDRDAALHAAEIDERNAQKKNKARVASKKTASQPKKKDMWSVESDSDVDSVVHDRVIYKPKVLAPALKKAPAGQQSARAPIVKQTISVPVSQKEKPIPPPDDSDYEMDFGESLFDRMKKKLVISPPPKKMSTSVAKKRPSPRADTVVIDSEDNVSEQVHTKPAKAAKKANERKNMSGKANVQKVTALSNDESEDDFAFASENDVAPASTGNVGSRARPARAAATKKATGYTFDDSEDEESDY